MSSSRGDTNDNRVHNPACELMNQAGKMASLLALHWYILDNEDSTAQAMNIIRDWSNNFNGFSTNGDVSQNALTAAWAAPHFVNAAEILRYGRPENSQWRPALGNQNSPDTNIVTGFLNILKDAIEAQPLANNYNNLTQSRIEALISIAIFTNDLILYQEEKVTWEDRINTHIYMRDDSPQRIPNGSENLAGRPQVHSWNFPASYGFVAGAPEIENGFGVETCRDLNHTDMGFRSMIYTAQMAFNQGDDLFAVHGDRLAAHMELHNGWREDPESSDHACADTNLFFKARSALSTVPGTYASNALASVKDADNFDMSSAGAAEYSSARDRFAGAATASDLVSIVISEGNESRKQVIIDDIAILANPSYFRHWGTRSPKCWGGPYARYPCTNGDGHNAADLWYLAYNHLNIRLGIPLPETYATISRYESSDQFPSDQHIDLTKWEGIMYHVGVHRNHYNTWQDCGVIRDRLYSFKNNNSGKYIFRDGANMIQLGSNPIGNHRVYQTIINGQFEGDKYYSIQHTPSDHLIEVEDGSTAADGANVISVGPVNTSRSQFTFEGRADGLCRIKPRSTQETDEKNEYCLNIANGDTSHRANVQQGLCASNSSDWIVTRH